MFWPTTFTGVWAIREGATRRATFAHVALVAPTATNVATGGEFWLR